MNRIEISDRVLVCSTKAQCGTIMDDPAKYLGILPNMENIQYCVHINTLLQSLIIPVEGNISVELINEPLSLNHKIDLAHKILKEPNKYSIPKKVYFTGQIRKYEYEHEYHTIAERVSSTVDNPNQIKKNHSICRSKRNN